MTEKEFNLINKGYNISTVVDLCRYDKDDLNEIVDTYISFLTENVTVSDNPICVYIGGQPGVGKSVLSHRMKRDCNAVELSMDACRMFHPNYEKIETAIMDLYKNKELSSDNNPGSDIAAFTQDFAANMINTLIDKISDMKYNILLEWNMRKADDVLGCMRKLKQKGYRNNALVLALDTNTSLEACEVRADVMNKHGHIVRKVSPEFHQMCVDSIPLNVDKIYKKGMEENILTGMNVVLRDGKSIWNIKDDKLPSDVLNEYYNNKDLSSEFKNDSSWAELSYQKESIGLMINEYRLSSNSFSR